MLSKSETRSCDKTLSRKLDFCVWLYYFAQTTITTSFGVFIFIVLLSQIKK